ncbi:hypothetical protein BKA80DRAFT_324667, partial [Phyllosticta citrichinensis]
PKPFLFFLLHCLSWISSSSHRFSPRSCARVSPAPSTFFFSPLPASRPASSWCDRDLSLCCSRHPQPSHSSWFWRYWSSSCRSSSPSSAKPIRLARFSGKAAILCRHSHSDWTTSFCCQGRDTLTVVSADVGPDLGPRTVRSSRSTAPFVSTGKSRTSLGRVTKIWSTRSRPACRLLSLQALFRNPGPRARKSTSSRLLSPTSSTGTGKIASCSNSSEDTPNGNCATLDNATRMATWKWTTPPARRSAGIPRSLSAGPFPTTFATIGANPFSANSSSSRPNSGHPRGRFASISSLRSSTSTSGRWPTVSTSTGTTMCFGSSLSSRPSFGQCLKSLSTATWGERA